MPEGGIQYPQPPDFRGLLLQMMIQQRQQQEEERRAVAESALDLASGPLGQFATPEELRGFSAAESREDLARQLTRMAPLFREREQLAGSIEERLPQLHELLQADPTRGQTELQEERRRITEASAVGRLPEPIAQMLLQRLEQTPERAEEARVVGQVKGAEAREALVAQTQAVEEVQEPFQRRREQRGEAAARRASELEERQMSDRLFMSDAAARGGAFLQGFGGPEDEPEQVEQEIRQIFPASEHAERIAEFRNAHRRAAVELAARPGTGLTPLQEKVHAYKREIYGDKIKGEITDRDATMLAMGIAFEDSILGAPGHPVILGPFATPGAMKEAATRRVGLGELMKLSKNLRAAAEDLREDPRLVGPGLGADPVQRFLKIWGQKNPLAVTFEVFYRNYALQATKAVAGARGSDMDLASVLVQLPSLTEIFSPAMDAHFDALDENLRIGAEAIIPGSSAYKHMRAVRATSGASEARLEASTQAYLEGTITFEQHQNALNRYKVERRDAVTFPGATHPGVRSPDDPAFKFFNENRPRGPR